MGGQSGDRGMRRDYGPQGCAAPAAVLAVVPLLLAAFRGKYRRK